MLGNIWNKGGRGIATQCEKCWQSTFSGEDNRKITAVCLFSLQLHNALVSKDRYCSLRLVAPLQYLLCTHLCIYLCVCSLRNPESSRRMRPGAYFKHVKPKALKNLNQSSFRWGLNSLNLTKQGGRGDKGQNISGLSLSHICLYLVPSTMIRVLKL